MSHHHSPSSQSPLPPSSSSSPLSSDTINHLAHFIIRPPRAHYTLTDLGPRHTLFHTTPVTRTDFTLRNPSEQLLHCSFYEPRETRFGLQEDGEQLLPVVLYCHGNGSCRLEGLVIAKEVLGYGVGLMTMDMSGSGMSDGEYISLGVKELVDVGVGVGWLRERPGVGKVCLWGHSMGAGTCLMLGGKDEGVQGVEGLVLDSPYASFEKIAQSMVHEIPLPPGVPKKLVLSVGVRAVRKVVREKAGFDINDIDPLGAARRCELPCFMVHGLRDKTITPDHSQLIYKGYKGKDKTLVLLERDDHESVRPPDVYDQIFLFLQRIFRKNGVEDDSIFVEVVKARGNDAIIAGRYKDAIKLYSEALKTIFCKEALNQGQFAAPVDSDFIERASFMTASGGLNEFSSPSRTERVRRRFSRSSRDYLFSRLSRSNRAATLAPQKGMNGGAGGGDDMMNGGSGSMENGHAGGMQNGHARNDKRSSCYHDNRKSYRRSRGRPGLRESPSSRLSAPSPTSLPLRPELARHGKRNARDHFQSRASSPNGRASVASYFSSSPSGKITPKSPIKRFLSHLKRRSTARRRRTSLFDDQAVNGHGHSGDPSSVLHTERFSSASIMLDERRRPMSNGHSSSVIGNLSFGKKDEEAEQQRASFNADSWNLTEKRRDMAVALFGNRSLAKGKVGDHDAALKDAEYSLRLNPKWTRGYLRKATALKNLSRLNEALGTLSTGLEIDPGNRNLMEMQRKLNTLRAEREQADGESMIHAATPQAEAITS